MGLFDRFRKGNKTNNKSNCENSQKSDMFLYTEEELDQYEAYISEQFGGCAEVFHEIISPDIHLDILIIPPTEKSNYYKLITMGMGAFPMNVPNELKRYELERAELILYLPPTWNIKSGREEDYWPIRQLKVLGRLPITCDTWLGFGHTVSSDAENTPYADNTKFCSMMLLTGVNPELKALDFRFQSLGKLNFYQLFPLYKEELEYKQNHDAQALLELFDDSDIMPIINIERKNYGLNA